MRIVLVIGALLLLSLNANAQVNPIGPFTGSDQEGFEWQTGTAQPCVPGRILNNQGDLCTPSGTGVYLTGSWGFTCTMLPHGGNKMCGTGTATSGGGIDITFDTPVSRFGGYFGMNHSAGPDITATFYAGPQVVSGPTVIQLPVDCSWYWLGWDMGGTGVDRIHFTTNHSSTGYLHMDDFEADFGPLCLVSYGQGCVGSGGFTPKLTAATCAVELGSFALDVTEGLGGATAFLVLGYSQASNPIVFGCTLNVWPVFPVVLSFPLGGSGAGTGTATLAGSVPAGTSGLSFTSQVFVVDPNVLAGFSNTKGLEVFIQ